MKKGFTLIEILLTIVILAAVSVTIGVSFSGMLNRQNEKDLEEYIEGIENSACVYEETHKGINEVTIGELIKAGLVRKNIVNPKDNKPVTDYENDKVTITWVDYEKKCTYNLVND